MILAGLISHEAFKSSVFSGRCRSHRALFLPALRESELPMRSGDKGLAHHRSVGLDEDPGSRDGHADFSLRPK